MSRKSICIVLVVSVLFLLTACSSSSSTQTSEAQPEEFIQVTAEPTELPAVITIVPEVEPEPTDVPVVEPEVMQPSPSASEAAIAGQPQIESPGRAEPPRPEDESEGESAETVSVEQAQDPNVRINYFRFSKSVQRPSEAATLEWNVEGVKTVQITRFGGLFGEAGEQWNVASSGSMQHTFPNTTAGFDITYLLTSVESESVASQFELRVPCEFTWALDVRDPSLLCPGQPRITDAAVQVFEGGLMVWVAQSDTIIYTNWDGTIYNEVPDTFEHGIDAVIDPTITAPEGYMQPDYGLGKVWQTYPEARIALGWALDSNIGYQAIRQGEPRVPVGNIDEFISLPNAGYIHMNSEGKWDVNFSQPEITLADERPPVDEGAAPKAAPTPETNDGVTIEYFRFNPSPSRPSDIVALEWSVMGVRNVQLKRVGGDSGEANMEWDLAAQGRIEQTFPPEVGGRPVVYVLTSTEAPEFSAEYVVKLPCEHKWVIYGASGAGCPTKPIISRGAQQDFQNGFMLWIEDEDIILYSNWEGTRHGFVRDTFEHGTDPVQDASLVPPLGFYQPDYGLGKVWRDEPGVRNMLGWAVDQAVDTEIRHQTAEVNDNGYKEFVTLRDGGLIIIDDRVADWSITYE